MRRSEENVQEFQTMGGQPAPQMQPMYGAMNIEAEIKINQLKHIVEKLQSLHMNNSKYQDALERGRASLQAGDYTSAAQYIQVPNAFDHSPACDLR